MPKRRRKRIKKKSNLTQRILGLFIAIFALTVGIYYFSLSDNISRIASNTKRENLQLETFKPSVTPKSKKPPSKNELCSHDTGIPVNSGENVEGEEGCFCEAILIVCEKGKCVDVIEERSGYQFPRGQDYCDLANLHVLCGGSPYAGFNGTYCVGKPVIYLYPKVPTLVNVRVDTDGEIFLSDPLYPEGGWKDVYAEPSGKLTYRGKEYRELFYESNVKDIRKPSRGLTIDSRNIRNDLEEIISKLGLIKDEKIEFLDYWVPKLKNLNSRYIFFGVIERDEKERIDKVLIEPKPDTFIEFIAYFAPLEKPFDGEKLELPSTPPQRIGFTAVEWGGTIGKQRSLRE